MTSLKPCPFCGGEAKAYNYWRKYIIECDDCEEYGHGAYVIAPTEAEAIKAWNTRAERTCKRVATKAKIPVDPYGLNLKTRHICSECNTEILPWFEYCEFCGAKVIGG